MGDVVVVDDDDVVVVVVVVVDDRWCFVSCRSPGFGGERFEDQETRVGQHHKHGSDHNECVKVSLCKERTLWHMPKRKNMVPCLKLT